MRIKLLLLASLLLNIEAHAQFPVNRTQSMVQKLTATWCVPCGQWGWTLQDEIAAENMVGATPKALVFESHGSLGSFHTETADSMTMHWRPSAIPDWAVNNIERTVWVGGGCDTYSTRILVKKEVDSLAPLAPLATTAFYYTLLGNLITFNTMTQFWKSANGTYAVGAYILEDSAYGEQQGRPGANDYHRNVLRGRISKNVFGDSIVVNKSVAANATFVRNFSFLITRTDWNKSKLKFFTVLWHSTGPNWYDWEVVNVNSIASAYNSKATQVGEIQEAVDQLLMVPNPASSTIHLDGVLMKNGDTRLTIINAIGQVVQDETISYQGNQLSKDIAVGQMPNGIYTLLIRSAGAQTLKKLVVAH